MSEASNPATTIDISLTLGELSVSVRGPPLQASELVAFISRNYSPVPAPAPSSPRESHYSFVEPVPASAWTAPSGQQLPSPPRPRFESREQIEASFESCPESFLRLGGRLSGGSFGAEHRVRRAWRAGKWARAVLDGRAQSPCRSEQIDLRPHYYVILRCKKISSPVCYKSSASYWRTIQSLAGTDSLSHSWPSEAEAKTYCAGAGVEFPSVEP